MHELSIATSIIQIIDTNIPSEVLPRIQLIKLEIGKLSGIEVDALTFAFDMLKAKTLYPQAQLQIVHIDGEAECLNCSTQFNYNYGDACCACGSYRLKIIRGKEMKVLGVETD